jgi:hypothetical protein
MEDLSSMFEPILIFSKETGEGLDFEKEHEDYIKNIHPILTKHNWFISPNVDFTLKHYISKNLNRQADPELFLNKVFVYFFTAGNFQFLDYLLGSWYCYSKVGDRFPILEECVNVLKDSMNNNSYIKNPHYVIIPTLISQIDGLKSSIIEQKKQKCLNNQINGSKRISEKKNVSELVEQSYVSFYNEPELSFINDWLLKESSTASDLLFDILFQPAQVTDKVEDLKPPFSRHKIMHGQYFEYGNMENTIRLFLLTDFLAELNYRMNRSNTCDLQQQ